jgi:hypothetical protein
MTVLRRTVVPLCERTDRQREREREREREVSPYQSRWQNDHRGRDPLRGGGLRVAISRSLSVSGRPALDSNGSLVVHSCFYAHAHVHVLPSAICHVLREGDDTCVDDLFLDTARPEMISKRRRRQSL